MSPRKKRATLICPEGTVCYGKIIGGEWHKDRIMVTFEVDPPEFWGKKRRKAGRPGI